MEYKDYYKSLGVDKSASKEELRKQYRKLARQYHPDVNTKDKGAAAKFSEISEAYEVLSDDEKRKKYDALGSDWQQHQSAGQEDHFDWSKYASSGGGGRATSTEDWDDLFGQSAYASEFFQNIFGGGFGGSGSSGRGRRGADMKAELEITLEEAYKGGPRVLTLGDRQIRLTLKPGIWDRQTIKITGNGAPGNKGEPNGDLYITFLIKPHPDYRVEGADLHSDIPVSPYEAMLGTSKEFTTISGKFRLRIPPGTKNGTVFRLKSKGFPVYGKADSFGDLFLKVAIVLPENLNPREKALLRELAALRNEKIEGDPK